MDAEADEMSRAARRAIERADERAVSAISWWELALHVRAGKISISIPLRSWLEELALEVRTMGITPAIAETAASLSPAFPKDPADRLIYATAIETGWPLITRDERLRGHTHSRKITIW
jgi:PIN domain nuclease of toxin-antitoxin system